MTTKHLFRPALPALAALAFLLALVGLPELAFAGPEGDVPKAGVMPSKEQGIVPMLVSLIVFGVVFAILSKKVWPVILKGLKDREEKIRMEIEAAETARRQAKEALEQYQKSLAEARAEAQRMIDQVRAQQAGFAAELKTKADAELALMRERALRDIEAARKEAVSEVYVRAAEVASEIAAKILRREVRAEDNRRLVDESIAHLQGSRN